MENLHLEATRLYKLYLSSDSADFVGCPDKIISKLNNLLEEGVYNVFKLRTSEPLFQAFDFVFSILENEWLPLFYHSNEVIYEHAYYTFERKYFLYCLICSFTITSVGPKLIPVIQNLGKYTIISV